MILFRVECLYSIDNLLPQLAKVLGCTIDELFGEGERAS